MSADRPALGPNHADGCDGSSWRYSGHGYNRVQVCACGAENHDPEIRPAPPDGYETWLDWYVSDDADCYTNVEEEYARAELAELRALAEFHRRNRDHALDLLEQARVELAELREERDEQEAMRKYAEWELSEELRAQDRLAVMGGAREARLMARVAELERTRDHLIRCGAESLDRVEALEQGRESKAGVAEMANARTACSEGGTAVPDVVGSSPTPGTPSPRVELRWNDDKTLDEALVYVGDHCVAHLEQMDSNYWWLGLGRDVRINLHSKKRIGAAVEDGLEHQPSPSPSAPEPTEADREDAAFSTMANILAFGPCEWPGNSMDRAKDEIARALARARAEGRREREEELRRLREAAVRACFEGLTPHDDPRLIPDEMLRETLIALRNLVEPSP